MRPTRHGSALESGRTSGTSARQIGVVLREFDVDAWSVARAKIAEFIAYGRRVAWIVKQLLARVIC